MSDYTVIRAVSLSLRQVLRTAITNDSDPQLNGIDIDLRSPKEMREDKNSSGVSFWLYRVSRDPDTLNLQVRRTQPDRISRQPIPLHLYYLVTPIRTRPEDEQLLLGRVIQVLNDHSILRGTDLIDTLAGAPDEFRIMLEPFSLEEITRVWTALEEPYQMSMTYSVQVVTIDSDSEAVEAPPVRERQASYQEIV
jgi:hypothetical protein